MERPAVPPDAVSPLQRGLVHRVAAEVRWAFTPPRWWLSGVAVNLGLSLVWLLWEPVRPEGHRDWVVLVGTYFASFILADVTTTNVLGVDASRVRLSLDRGIELRRLLVTKNLALLVIVGAPTLALTGVLTTMNEGLSRLAVTLPDVALPILAWLGVGNLVSVVLPVVIVPVKQRWTRRLDLRGTSRWLIHLALPYGLYYLVAPVGGTSRLLLGSALSRSLGPVGRADVHALIGALLWVLGTLCATAHVRLRGLRLR
ncbi:MAG: hypothetical protein ACXVGQ_15025 [Mycobacteriaceae bacterium]